MRQVALVNEEIDKSIIDFPLLHINIQETNIPGILVLENTKVYGKTKNGKLLYRCIPNDIMLPNFIIPYEIILSTNLALDNIYITFHFIEWNDIYPIGMITHIIGNVSDVINYYEYQLYCKNLIPPISQFTKDTMKKIGIQPCKNIKKINMKYPNIQNRTNFNIYTIDLRESNDYEDGFSIIEYDDGYILSIYISNVTLLLDYLDLWESFSQRISTIFLPNGKRLMLPVLISDDICSLRENNKCFCFTLDIMLDKNYIIEDINICNTMICVSKNYNYEEPELLENKSYILLKQVFTSMLINYNYIEKIKDSHDVINYMIILMNHIVAKQMKQFKNGIFCRNNLKNNITLKNIKITEDSIGINQYDLEFNMKHSLSVSHSIFKYIDGMNEDPLFNESIDIENNTKDGLSYERLDYYLHITSPNHRLVDLLNIIQFQINTEMVKLSDKAYAFHKKWINQIDMINLTMKNITQVQIDCILLGKFTNN